MKVNLAYRKSDGAILFAEAKKDFVDFLMSLLVLPVGWVLMLLRRNEYCSTIEAGAANLYESVCNLDESVMQVNKKDVLMEPAPSGRQGRTLGINDMVLLSAPDYFKCGYGNGTCCNMTASSDGNEVRPSCPDHGICSPMKMRIVSGEDDHLPVPVEDGSEGYVKQNVIFMVTDDLEVYPIAPGIRNIVLLDKLKVNSMADLGIVEVSVGLEETWKLLKAYLSSKTVLNDVFGSYIPHN